MEKRKTIDSWSFLYRFLQIFLVRPAYNFYYRKIRIVDAQKIPKGESLILAPNHQNALMDALAFVAGIKFQTVFLARADVFKGGLIDKILTFLKILPIYRIRDGISSLQKNDDIFDITVNVLHNKINPLLLFPEGNHGDKRRLRPLVKGIFRIAFKAQEEYKSQPGIKIMPVGIDYSHYWKFRQTQLIVFGESIEVSEYWNAYEENPTTGINSLRERLAREMKNYMIHIETEEFYDLYMALRIIYRDKICRNLGLKPGDLYNEFLADKKLIDCLDECLRNEQDKIRELQKVYTQYATLRKKLNFRDWVPVRKRYGIVLNILSILFSILFMPIALLGLLNNWPHFIIPIRFTRGIKDTQFFSTAKWGAGFAILIIYYLILFILAMIFLPVWWIKIIYLLTLPSTGIFALSYRNFLIKAWARIRYSISMLRKNSATVEFKKAYDNLILLTDKIIWAKSLNNRNKKIVNSW